MLLVSAPPVAHLHMAHRHGHAGDNDTHTLTHASPTRRHRSKEGRIGADGALAPPPAPLPLRVPPSPSSEPQTKVRKLHSLQQVHTQVSLSCHAKPVEAAAETDAQTAAASPSAADPSAAASTLPLHLQPCARCGSELQPKQINLMQQLYMCSDQQCPYPLNSGHLSAFWVSHPILPHLHVLMHEDGNVNEDTRRSQSQSPCKTAAGATAPRRSPLLTGTTGIAAVPLPPIRAAAACFSNNQSNDAASSFPDAAAAAAVSSSSTAGANSHSSTRVSASSTVLAALQSEAQQQQQQQQQCAVAPAPSAVHAVSALPSPSQLPPVSLPAVAAVQSSDSSHARGLSSPSLSLSLPQSDGWGDADLLQLSVPDASSADDANMQLMIAEMQERKQMEELDQQGLLWED